MPIRITKLLHAGVRVGPGDENVKKALDFYEGLLGLQRDEYRPYVAGVPGHWMNVKEGDRSLQVHLFGAEGVSPLTCDGPDQVLAAQRCEVFRDIASDALRHE